jgi:hypothetical protein
MRCSSRLFGQDATADGRVRRGRTVAKSLSLLAAVLALLAFPRRTLAKDKESSPLDPRSDASIESWMSEGRIHLELVAGYAWAWRPGESQTAALPRQFAVASPRLGLFPLGVIGDTPFLHGAFEVLGQLTVFAQTKPRAEGYAAGPGLILRWNWWTGTRVVPYFHVSAGLMPNDLGLPEEGGHFDFQLFGGFGAQILLTEGAAITLEADLHHISCADIERPNHGINTVVVLGGLSFFF